MILIPAQRHAPWASRMGKSRSIGALTIRPHIRDGQTTGSWQVDVPATLSLDGKRKRLSYAGKREAEEAARQLIMQLRQQGSILADRTAAPGCTVASLIECWADEQGLRVRSGKKRQASLRTNLFQLGPLIDHLGYVAVATLTSRDLEGYQAARVEAGIKAITVNSETATFTQVMRWAVENGKMPRAVRVDRLPTPRAKDTTLSVEEARAILLHVDGRWRPLVRLLMETGCRFGEAAQLTWDQIDLTSRTARIEQREDWRPKTDLSVRTLDLSPQLCAELSAAWAPDRRFVFEGRRAGRPVDDLRRPLEKAVEAAGLTRDGKPLHLRPKDIRASFATWFSVIGVRERVLQEALGHAPGSRVTKRHYEQSTRPERLQASTQLTAMLAEVVQP